MKFYKPVLIFIIIILFLGFVKLYFFQNTARFFIETKNVKVTSQSLNLPIKIYSPKDGIYRFTFKVKQEKKEFNIPQSYIIALKKGQQYELNCELQSTSEVNFNNLQPTFVLETTLEEIFPRTKKYTKSVFVKTPTLPPAEVQITTQPPTVTVQPAIEKKEEVVFTEKKIEVVEQPIKEKIEYTIYVNTETVKKEYKYGEKLQVTLKINNQSIKTPIRANITNFLMNISEIIISSNNFQINLKPQETKEQILEFDFVDDLLPDFYFLKSIVTIDSKQHLFTSDTFQLIDSSPVITLHELPTIKYKQTNTILVEVEDDRGISEVKFVQVDTKRNLSKDYPMILIAGSKKTGLYSYTTEKINQKDYYSFYIQVNDISGNTSKTELFKIKISK